MSDREWTRDNTINLLENGEDFFADVFDAIALASKEIIIETYIWFDDEVGQKLQTLLIEAAGRGVQVDVTVDGYGSASLTEEFYAPLSEAGVNVHIYGPVRPVLGDKTDLFRRLHRKIVVIDGRWGWIGGINFSVEHLRSFGSKSKQDYAVRVKGPIVDDMRQFCREALGEKNQQRRSLRGFFRRLPRGWDMPDSKAQALLVSRDNHNRRTAIEAMYRMGLRNAQSDIIIMNAYFFPGYRFLRAMRQAVQRGARVRLILQGSPDKYYVKFAGSTMYDHLLNIGVEIWEFMERPHHAKVAIMDDAWATVGSSNLDPFSLSLNLEANLFVRDKTFASDLRARLETLMDEHCRRVTREEVAHRSAIWHVWRWMGYHLLRHFPRMAQLVPIEKDRLKTINS